MGFEDILFCTFDTSSSSTLVNLGQKLKVISFSLWESNPKYTIGAITNIELASEYYPGFEVRIYVDETVPPDILSKLISLGGKLLLVKTQSRLPWRGMYWRYLPALEEDVDVLISRDADSRINRREASAVFEWLAGNESLHLMRDHPGHYMPIMGGMCGFRAKALRKLRIGLTNVGAAIFESTYNSDQLFLRDLFIDFPIIDTKIHDEIFDISPFPQPRNGLEFVGEAFDESGAPNADHTSQLEAWLSFKRICPFARLVLSAS